MRHVELIASCYCVKHLFVAHNILFLIYIDIHSHNHYLRKIYMVKRYTKLRYGSNPSNT